MKKLRLFSIVILVMALFLPGCSSREDAKQPSTSADPAVLRVVTEQTVADGMNHQAEQLAAQLQERYTHVTVQLEILPTEESQCAARLSQLRQDINQGNGPDVYLLPTESSLILDTPVKYTYTQVEPVFQDVTKAMYEGYFLDISRFYEEDTALDKEQLNTCVMDAGVIGESRYTLPLRFDAPVLYVWDDYFENNQIDPAALQEGIGSWMAYLTRFDDPALACGGEYLSVQAFSQVLDYSSGQVTLDRQTLSEYLRLSQQIQADIGTAADHRSVPNLELYTLGIWDPVPIQVNSLGSALAYAAVAKAEERSLAMYPIRTVEGDYIAQVTYYAAIGRDSQIPEIAYDYIRQFLLADWQWERTRPVPASDQAAGLIQRSFPVRTSGCVEPLWDNWKAQPGDTVFSGIALTQEDVPLLYGEFDLARYPVPAAFTGIGATLNDYSQGNTPTDVDIDALAQSVLDTLALMIK